LKLALDALENHTAIKHPQQIHYRDAAIDAIKEALAQPAQEPFDCPRCGHVCSQRPWVGLTDEEIDVVCAPLGFAQLSPREVACAVLAKSKEKNT